jgi:flagellar biosynthesis protein FliR
MNASPVLAVVTVVFSMAEVVRFAVVLCRIGGIMVFAPIFSSRSIPSELKVTVTLVATVALCPALALGKVPANLDLTGVLGFCMSELLFGMLLGLVSNFIFAGLQTAGQIISFQLGFSIINVIDPQTEVETSVISFLQYYLGFLFFLMIDGHHWFFQAVSDSFNYLPVGGIRLHGRVVEEVVRLSSEMFVTGLQVAGPVLAVTIISDVALGMISRAAPQINVLIVGMPLKTLVGFACMGVSFYFLPRLLGASYAALFEHLFTLLRGMAG